MIQKFQKVMVLSPLHIACLNGHLNVTKYFITEQNCDPTSQNQDGWTPLHCASRGGHMNIIQYLITEKCCDPKIPKSDGALPLHIACRCGHLNVTKYFITEQNCDPTSQDQDGRTPLHYASQGGHMNIIQYLITEKCCDPKIPKSNGALPLHIACHHGHLNVTKYFITEQNCDPTSQDQDGRTPLHYASQGGHMNIIQYLITEKCCDPKIPKSNGALPLHIACHHGHLNVTKYFITEQNCDPTSQDQDGRTPLHYASQGGHMNIIQYLITEKCCDPKIPKSDGALPLHIACHRGHLNVTKYFITEQNCDPASQNQNGWTPLHCASRGGHMNIIQYLITEKCCDPKIPKSDGALPLHIACRCGHLNVTKYFITEQNCDPTSQDQDGRTPLHYASQGGHMNIIQYLITEKCCDPKIPKSDGALPLHIACRRGHLNVTKYFITEQNCDPTSRNLNGWTPLHYASQGGHIHIVQWLLHNGQVDIMAISNLKETCIDLGGEMFKLVKLLMKSIENFPIQTCSRMFLTGNHCAGKTTLVKVISEHAMTQFGIGNVQQVKSNTADTFTFPTHKVGQLVLYDMAGLHAVHHVATESEKQQSPATFITVTDLNNTNYEITQQLCYWLNVIDSATSCTTTAKSCLIIVGSHVDLLSKRLLQTKLTLINNLVQGRVKIQEFIGVVATDCHKIKSASIQKLMSLIYKSHQAVVARSPTISYYCHLLYDFLKSKLDMPYCTLQELISSIVSQNNHPMPFHSIEVPFLTELLVTLSDKGLIVFLDDQQQLENSWIVVDTATIQKNIDEILFTPQKILVCHQIGSNIGIMHSSSLKELFPHYNLEMLIGFLHILELCYGANMSDIATNFQTTGTSILSDVNDCLLIFPCLLDTCQPIANDNVDFSFGWCLCCKILDNQYFSSHFFYVLLLRLYHTSTSDSDKYVTPPNYEKGCAVWTNGISWDNEEGVTTTVELVNYNQRVVVFMSPKKKTRKVEFSKHRSAVIRLILDLHQKLCPDMKTTQYLISHHLLKNSSNDIVYPSDSALFSIKDVAKSMLHRTPYIVSNTTQTSDDFTTEDVLKNEPYYQLSPSSVWELMDSSKADELASESLLSEVQNRCRLHWLEQQSHSCLRKCVDEFSIFTGRNPFVSYCNKYFACCNLCIYTGNFKSFYNRHSRSPVIRYNFFIVSIVAKDLIVLSFLS